MKITMRSKGVTLTESVKAHLEEKLGRLDRYFDKEVDVQAKITVEKDRHKSEVTINLPHTILRSEETTEDMYASIDAVVDKIERQIEKYKTRLDRKHKGLGFKAVAPISEAIVSEGDIAIKRKSFSVKPMAEEEAIMQMNLLGHNFYVYLDADTEKVSVAYVRKDGSYGIIEAQYA